MVLSEVNDEYLHNVAWNKLIKNNWIEHLSDIQFYINNAYHKGIGCSPLVALQGHTPFNNITQRFCHESI
ncbi:hypothetical protein DLAC_10757 [Tieghemostelium lacteum]|uniref:Uncharacterized protein n=1 Tax=Tieghemostelium lacteum TaxID=361077 RepID=A0A151Z439_TIELA|nr:hypothetical protein DLAC_10757 [Tieghemostelium lacteum]|eukprot:KYQ88730.1 hypothetical protein DLAC_10757 [Tieghemostelium lacteum]